MSLIFPNLKTDDPQAYALLDEAYEKACDQLTEEHQVTSSRLGLLVDPITTAISDLYNAGQRDATLLANYAVSRAIKSARVSGRWLFDE